MISLYETCEWKLLIRVVHWQTVFKFSIYRELVTQDVSYYDNQHQHEFLRELWECVSGYQYWNSWCYLICFAIWTYKWFYKRFLCDYNLSGNTIVALYVSKTRIMCEIILYLLAYNYVYIYGSFFLSLLSFSLLSSLFLSLPFPSLPSSTKLVSYKVCIWKTK